MKKILTFLVFPFICGSPVFIKAQTAIKSTGIANHQKFLAVNFIEAISFISHIGSKTNITEEPKVVIENKKTTEISPVSEIEKLSSPQVKYAMMMDVDLESTSNTSLYNFVESWYGTRYRMGGTTKKGIDCSAFTATLFSNVYNFVISRTAKDQYKDCEHINKNELSEGDLVFFNTRGGISHVGVYLANGYFVHSSASQGVMISNLSESYFAKRFIRGGRINKTDDCAPAK